MLALTARQVLRRARALVAMANLIAVSILGLGCLRGGYREIPADEPALPVNAQAPKFGGVSRVTPAARIGSDASTVRVSGSWGAAGAEVAQDAGAFAPRDAATLDAAVDGGAARADSIVGTWSIQDFTDQVGTTYDVCMTVRQADQLGVMAGDIVYDNGLDCTGYLTLTAQSGPTYSLAEMITGGQHRSYCAIGGGGQIDAALTARDRLHWTWRRRDGTLPIADTTLERVETCP